jgi:hypothetical protein
MISIHHRHLLVFQLLPGAIKPAMTDRLCAPLSHVLLARNWNFAISGEPLTASSVANSAAVSTPLRELSVTVVMTRFLPLDECLSQLT